MVTVLTQLQARATKILTPANRGRPLFEAGIYKTISSLTSLNC